MKYKTADIKLGYGCNDKCIHCVVAKLRDIAIKNKHLNLKTKEYITEINKVIQNGITQIVLTGGEPTIRKDFTYLVDYIHKTGTKIILQTNGRLLSNIKLSKSIQGKIDNYIIALHGSNKLIHENITQTPNSYNQTIQGIKNISKLGGNICGKTIISKLNYNNLLEICKKYDDLGIKEIFIAYPHSSGETNYLKNIAPTYTQIKQEIQNCIDWAEKNKINLKLESILPCNLSKENSIKYFYDFTEILSQKKIKMLDSNYKSWDKYTKISKKKDFSKCQKCIFNMFCNGFWSEYIELYGFNEMAPITKIKNKNNLKY